jgi:hypothetical protein
MSEIAKALTELASLRKENARLRKLLGDLSFERCDCSLSVNYGSYVWIAETHSELGVAQWKAARDTALNQSAESPAPC